MRAGAFFGSSFFSVSSAGCVALRNASRFPSGDHAGEAAPFASEVRSRASPPSIGSTQSCGGAFASFLRTKASVRPSGDHRGCESNGPKVSARAAPPSLEITHSALRYSSASASTWTRVNATRAPSGEICGSAAQAKRRRSSGCIGRGEVWACDSVAAAACGGASVWGELMRATPWRERDRNASG